MTKSGNMADALKMIGMAGWFRLDGKPCMLWRGSDGLWYAGEELQGYRTQAEVISTYKLEPTEEPNV